MSLKARRWFRRLCCFYKFKSYGLPPYLFQLISHESHSYNTCSSEDIPTYRCRTDSFNNSFFHGPFVSGINLIYVFVNQLTVYLGIIYLVIQPQPSATLIFVIFLVCAYWQGCDWV